MPADGRGGSLVLPGPQMVVRVSPDDGEVRVYPVGQPALVRDQWQCGAKYFQHTYSSHLGFCLDGEGGRDLGAGRSGFSLDGKDWAFRAQPYPIRMETDHVASVYEMDFAAVTNAKSRSPFREFGQITTHTLIGDAGEIHVFWHNSARPVYLYCGGYGVSVAGTGEPRVDKDAAAVTVHGSRAQSTLCLLAGPVGRVNVELLTPRTGWQHTHLFGGRGAYPYWRSDQPVAPGAPVVIRADGARGRPIADVTVSVTCQPEAVLVRYEGREYRVPLPY